MTSTRSRSESRPSRLRTLYRRATWWQKALSVVLALVVIHGLYVLFVPGVDIADDELECPPAVVAAVAGSGGLPTAGDAEAAAAHDAACRQLGRRWTLGAVGQVAVGALWALAVLEWGRVWRRARRAERRRRRHERRRTEKPTSEERPAESAEASADRDAGG